MDTNSSSQGAAAASELIRSLLERGVRVWSQEGELLFRAPKGALRPADREHLTRLKSEILTLLRDEHPKNEIPLKARQNGQRVPLTYGQESFWDYSKNHNRISRRICTASTRICGALNISSLQCCINYVVSRHESLRTRLIGTNERPEQHIDEPHASHMEILQVSTDADVSALIGELANEKVDLSTGPLFKARLFILSAVEYVLSLAAEHTIADDESTAILVGEIWSLYDQKARGQDLVLPARTIQFPDFAVWQRQTHDARLQAHGTYWRDHFRGVKCIQLPFDMQANGARTPVAVRKQIELGAPVSERLRTLAGRAGTPLSVAVLALHAFTVAQWCNQQDFVIHLTWNGRNRPELEGVVGCLAYDLPLRVKVIREECFLDLVRRTNLEFNTACEHEDFTTVSQQLPECASGINFNWLSSKSRNMQLEFEDGVYVETFPYTRPALLFDFASFFFCDPSAGIAWSVEYRSDLFRQTTIDRLLGRFKAFAVELVRHPAEPMESIIAEATEV